MAARWDDSESTLATLSWLAELSGIRKTGSNLLEEAIRHGKPDATQIFAADKEISGSLIWDTSSDDNSTDGGVLLSIDVAERDAHDDGRNLRMGDASVTSPANEIGVHSPRPSRPILAIHERQFVLQKSFTNSNCAAKNAREHHAWYQHPYGYPCGCLTSTGEGNLQANYYTPLIYRPAQWAPRRFFNAHPFCHATEAPPALPISLDNHYMPGLSHARIPNRFPYPSSSHFKDRLYARTPSTTYSSPPSMYNPFRHSTHTLQLLESRNPYPGININQGWNRAIYRGSEHLYDFNASHATIVANFTAYTLRFQRPLLRLGVEAEHGFCYVFKAQGKAASRPHWLPFRGKRVTRNLYGVGESHEADLVRMQAGLQRWREHTWRLYRAGQYRFRPLKRKVELAWEVDVLFFLHELIPKRLKPEIGRCVGCGVWDEKWRARRRERERRGGRWTDGTKRQWLLWAGFHWVLDGDVSEDPLWQRRAFEDEGI